MGELLERNRGIAARAADPSPIGERAREILRAGKREQLLAGVDAQGVPFAPPSPATLRKKGRGPGPVLVPDGEASRLIREYTVTVDVHPGRLELSAGWPGNDWVRYHRTGTRRMPKRDPGGFREQDRARCLELLRGHVIDG